MASLLIHAGLGVACFILFLRFNRHLYRGSWVGAGASWNELLCYSLALGSVVAGWYFNTQYMQTYGDEAGWLHFTKLLFTNPAAASGAQDLIVSNTFLFPLWTMIDGPRRGLKHCWIYFVLSLFTSFGFAMGLYIAAQERQLRWNDAQKRQPVTA